MLVLFAGIGYNIPRTLCFQKDEFMRDKLFSDRDFLKRLFALTLPIAFQSLMLASVAAADAIMLGRIDQDAMSAVSLATQIQFVQNMILSSCTGTAAVLGAQYWGKGDKKTINDIFCMILRLCGLASFVFFALCTFIPEHLMAVFTNVPQLIEIGAGYLKIAGWSYLLTGISQCYIAIFKVTEHVPRAAWISSGAVVINIVLNAVLIYEASRRSRHGRCRRRDSDADIKDYRAWVVRGIVLFKRLSAPRLPASFITPDSWRETLPCCPSFIWRPAFYGASDLPPTPR